MKKRVKMYVALWLALVMLFAVTPAAVAAETTAEPAQTEAGPAESDTTEEPAPLEEPVPEEPQNITFQFVLVGTKLDPMPTENPYEIWLDLEAQGTAGQSAWELTEQVLKAQGYAYDMSPWGGHLQKLTPPAESGKPVLENGVTNGSQSSWMWTYNDNDDKAASDYVVQNGDEIRWYFTNDWNTAYLGHPEAYVADPGNELVFTQDVPEPETSYWPAFGGSMRHNATKTMDGFFPAGELTVENVFSKTYLADTWLDHLSDPIQVGDYTYVVFKDTLYRLNAKGEVLAEGVLKYPIGFMARPAYADGRIVVPLKNGGLQAFAADTLKTVWVIEAPFAHMMEGMHGLEPIEWQSAATITVVDGLVLQPLVAAGWDEYSYAGHLRAVDLRTGATEWTFDIEDTGFYWSGAGHTDTHVVIGDDFGRIYSIRLSDGTVTDQTMLPLYEGKQVSIRSNMVSVPEAPGDFFFVSKHDGMLNRISVDENGKLTGLERVKFTKAGLGSTCSPTLLDGKAYVAGQDVLAIIDTASMTVDQAFDIEGYIQSTPLVLKDAAGRVMVFFTINSTPGGLEGLDPATGEIGTLYLPDEALQNFCMASPSVSPDGTLYYSNDSNTLFALKLQLKKEAPQPKPTEPKPSEKVPVEPEQPEKPERPEPPAVGETSVVPYALVILLLGALLVSASRRTRTKEQ